MPYYFHLGGKNAVAISFTSFLVNIKIIFQIIYDLKQAYSCGIFLKLYVYLKLLSTAFEKKSENFSLRIMLKNMISCDAIIMLSHTKNSTIVRIQNKTKTVGHL